jgi:hypothetical protein
MGMVKPGRRQVRVLHLEPKRAGATIGNALLALLFLSVVVAALAYRTSAWPSAWRPKHHIPTNVPLIVAAVAGFLALVALVVSVHNGQRWHIARVIERMSRDPAMAPFLPDHESTPQANRASTIPPLEVRIVKARKLAKPRSKLRRVSVDQNVVGHRPLQIAYLRLFDNQPRMRTFIEGAWREFGYVYFLRPATSVTLSEYKWAKKSNNFAGLFISARDQLLPALERRAVQPKGRYRFKAVGATTIKVKDKYGSYSVGALLCHGSYWKAAVDVLLDRVDLVALDLSGFRPENLGTQYELQRVVDRFPIERVVFLADPYSKTKFLDEQVRLAWSQMAAGSPNAVPEPKLAMVAIVDSFATRVRTTGSPGPAGGMQAGGAPGMAGATPAGFQGQGQTVVSVRLEARRKETRRVAAMAQDRLDAWAATTYAPVP